MRNSNYNMQLEINLVINKQEFSNFLNLKETKEKKLKYRFVQQHFTQIILNFLSQRTYFTVIFL